MFCIILYNNVYLFKPPFATVSKQLKVFTPACSVGVSLGRVNVKERAKVYSTVKKTLYGGKFTLSTHLIILNCPVKLLRVLFQCRQKQN